MVFLRLIFITVLIYYVLKTVARNLFPFLFNKAVQNINNQNNKSNIKQKKSGDITIYFEETKNKKRNSGIGEYVDYEEVKD
jgi:hypothetical protein